VGFLDFIPQRGFQGSIADQFCPVTAFERSRPRGGRYAWVK